MSFKAIVEAAIKQDKEKLNELLNKGVSINALDNKEKMTPVYFLAKENNVNAVYFLLSHHACINGAVSGFAIAGNVRQVNELIEERKACIHEALNAYASVGRVEQVNDLIEKKSALVNVAVEAYAKAYHVEQVNHLIEKKSACMNAALRGYAMGGHLEQVNALLEKSGMKVEAAVWGYALRYHLLDHRIASAKELFKKEEHMMRAVEVYTKFRKLTPEDLQYLITINVNEALQQALFEFMKTSAPTKDTFLKRSYHLRNLMKDGLSYDLANAYLTNQNGIRTWLILGFCYISQKGMPSELFFLMADFLINTPLQYMEEILSIARHRHGLKPLVFFDKKAEVDEVPVEHCFPSI